MIFEPLKSGDTVGVCAPASPVGAEQLQHGVAWLEGLGYQVVLGESVGTKDRFLAGPDADRARDLERMFADPNVRAVFTARGGYGSSRLLNLIDWGIIRDNPKPFIGFSDTTALQAGIYTQVGLVSLSGLALSADTTAGPPPEEIESDITEALVHSAFAPVSGLSHDQDVFGILVGGCLSLITHLIGTPYLPALDGHILLLEDVGERPYRLDRMLTQLLLSSILENAEAVAVGTFFKCDGDEEDGTVASVIDSFVDRCPCPVIQGVPYGHGPIRRVLPIGLAATVAAGKMTFVSE